MILPRPSTFLMATIFLFLSIPTAVQAALTLSSPLPHSGLRVNAIDSGELAMSVFEFDPTSGQILGEFGASSIGLETTGSYTSFRVDNTLYSTFGTHGAQRTVPSQVQLNKSMAAQTWILGDVRVVMNLTLVRNATLIDVRIHNDGVVSHSFAMRQTLDNYLNGVSDGQNSAPWLRIANQAGNVDPITLPGIYRTRETLFRDVDFPQIKLWQTPSGPNLNTSIKAYVSWDAARGGTPPDEIILASPKALDQPWDYSVDPPPYRLGFDPATNNYLLLYWGYDEPIHLAPGGAHDVTFWYGRDQPPIFESSLLSGQFLDGDVGGPDAFTRIRSIDAGETTYYPIEIHSRGTVAHDIPKREAVRLALNTPRLPIGWSTALVADNTEAPAPPMINLSTGESYRFRLRVSAPPTAAGDEVARTDLVATAINASADIDKLRNSPTAVLSTTTAVALRSTIGLQLMDERIKVSQPGQPVTFNVTVTNLGNVRNPPPIALDVSTLLGPGWDATYKPNPLTLGKGGSGKAVLTVNPPPDAAAGRYDITLRARSLGAADYNTTTAQILVADNSQVELGVDGADARLAPGATHVYTVTATNFGPTAVPAAFELRRPPDPTWNWTTYQDGATRGQLLPGQTAVFLVQVEAPASAAARERQDALVLLKDPSGRRKPATLALAAIVDHHASIQAALVEPTIHITPDGIGTATVTVTNRGNAMDNLTLVPVRSPPGFTFQSQPASLQLQPGKSGKFTLRVNAPPDARAGPQPLVLTVRSLSDASKDSSDLVASANIARRLAAALELDRTHVFHRPGEPLLLRANLTNHGNSDEVFTLETNRSEWEAQSVTPIILRAEPGQSLRVLLALDLPSDLAPGSHSVQLFLRSTLDLKAPVPGKPAALQIEIQRPELAILAFRPIEPRQVVGTLVPLEVTVANTGTGSAAILNVTLSDNGQSTGSPVHLENLTAGRTIVVGLTWVASPGRHDLEVALEIPTPQDDANPDNNQAQLQLRVPATPGSADLAAIPSPDLGWALLGVVAAFIVVQTHRRPRER